MQPLSSFPAPPPQTLHGSCSDGPSSCFPRTAAFGELWSQTQFPSFMGQLSHPRPCNPHGLRSQGQLWVLTLPDSFHLHVLLYISFSHPRFSLVPASCHWSFPCLLSAFDSIPLVPFKSWFLSCSLLCSSGIFRPLCFLSASSSLWYLFYTWR